MKFLLSLALLLLLPLAVATDASGGNYSAQVSAGLQAGNASGGGYAAQGSLGDDVQAQDATYAPPAPSSSSSSGGSSGGGITPIKAIAPPKAGDPVATAARVWGAMKAGEELSYETDLAFSAITLLFTQDVSSARITLKQYNSTPNNISQAPGLAYAYLSVEHQGLATAPPVVEVSVSKDWMQENRIVPESITLYRLEGQQWIAYKTIHLHSDEESMIYRASVPGFSYFAISGERIPVVQQPLPQPEAPVEPDAPELVAPVKEQPAEFVSTLPEQGRIPAWIIILVVVIVAGIGSVVGLKQYQEYQVRESHRLEEVRKEGAQKRAQVAQPAPRPPEHDPMWQLQQYIVAQRAKGTPDDLIRQRLLSIGWDELVVDMEMMK